MVHKIGEGLILFAIIKAVVTRIFDEWTPLRAQQRWQRADAFWSLLKSIGFSNGRGKKELEEKKISTTGSSNKKIKRREENGKRDPRLKPTEILRKVVERNRVTVVLS